MALMSGFLSAELAATCNALGYYDGSKYHLEPHCRETIRDLIRYLRRDQQSHEIRRYLGHTKLLQTDLLPIIQCHHKELELFDVALRLTVNLTNPALLVYNEVIPTDKYDLNQYMELVTQLQTYKEAFNDHKIWTPFTERLSTLLNKSVEDRDEDDQRTIERILILVRNLLHVPASTGLDWRPDNDASIHDQVAWALHQSGMLDLLLYIASSEQESNFYMHLLEIICLLLREQPPALLAQTKAQRSVEEKLRDDQELLKMRHLEAMKKQQKTRKYLGIRHSNFGGTFIVKNLKSTSDKDMIFHKPIQEAVNVSFDKSKEKMKVPKNKQPLKHENLQRRSALSVRLVLKQFCVEILHAAYNPLMKHIKDCLSRGKSQDNDESYYFTALKFFMEFNRFYDFHVKYVSETMSVDTFHFVQKYLENWFEMMTTDKKKLKFWSARMHLALKAYKELLQNFILMDRNDNPAVRESSKVIKSNIFYVIEYREMLLSLALSYKKQNFSTQYLVDLIETIHIFLKLLCDFCKNKKIVVQGKKQVRRKSKKNKKKTNAPEVNYEELWDQNSEEIAKVLTEEIQKEVVPFDATLELDMTQQKLEAIKKIQLHLKSGDFEDAIALLRASREVWPENDTFGSENTNPEEELSCLKEVFLAELDVGKRAEQNTEQEPEAENDDEEDEEEEDIYPDIREQNFDVMDLIKRYASPKVVQICGILLSRFETNSDFTNRCIVKMLHRIAWDCKLPSILFQASLFIQFQKILRSEEVKYNELAKLAIFIIRKFIEIAQKNKKVFVELLFFKTIKEAVEVEEGYGSTTSNKNKLKGHWEEHEEDELRRLVIEYESSNPPEKMVDWILENLIRKDRSKKAVSKKLKEMGLFVDKPVKTKKWSADLEQELTRLFEEFKDTDDPLGSITEKLSEERSRQAVASALLRLGLVQDKKELRKKRKTKSKKSKSGDRSESESDLGSDINDVESDEEDENLNEPKRNEEIIPKLADATRKLYNSINGNKYLIEGLKWVSSCIEDCLEDLEDEDPTEVPLLPLSEDSILSIENNDFQQFLLALSFNRPFQQQEIYWRFPATWKVDDFKNRQRLINYIAHNFESGLSALAQEINECILLITGEMADILKINEPKETETDSQMNTEDFDKMIARHCQETLNKELSESGTADKSPVQTKNKYRKKVVISDESESETEEPPTNKNKKLNLSQFAKSDSSSGEESEGENQKEDDDDAGMPAVVRRQLYFDTSDDEEPIQKRAVPEVTLAEKENKEPEGNEEKPAESSFTVTKQDRIDSDEEDEIDVQIKRSSFTVTKRDRIDSDEEEEIDVQIKRKKRLIIESDEDD